MLFTGRRLATECHTLPYYSLLAGPPFIFCIVYLGVFEYVVKSCFAGSQDYARKKNVILFLEQELTGIPEPF